MSLIQLTRPDPSPGVLTPEALAFVAELQRRFGPTRELLLEARVRRQEELDRGVMLGFLPQTREVRESKWLVAPAPADLDDRRVEITGPAEAKMLINALNCGARVFMADLEDSLSPTWENVVQGQEALRQAVRHTLALDIGGKSYRLNEKIATLLVRPRGWHLEEKHALLAGAPVSASLFDFGLFVFHNAREQLTRGTAPYFYLPKMESHLEARLWNDVFVHAQKSLGIERGTFRATVLIETLPAAFEMEEILFELREHAAGLNAGRWDYIFSAIKKLRVSAAHVLPDRGQVSMAVPFMRAYSSLLVRTCHKRGAHAMGGMAAFIPNRRDPAVTENALKKVREDKERESNDGFDGTWVAHPDLVPLALEIFDAKLGAKPHQKHCKREDAQVTAAQLTDFHIEGGKVTEAGIRQNVDVALQYIERWLSGTGAAAIHNLMEDAATAEISRAQLWQWLRHGRIDRAMYERVRDEERKKLSGGRYADAASLLDELVLSESFTEFLTLPAYRMLP